ncbi:Uncharacterised protein [Bordetella pertussis]|nr:Uncharacterised protein [Bordetella pertussis]CPK47012.1 Uncharacterised protein [Bordetella pertussis]
MNNRSPQRAMVPSSKTIPSSLSSTPYRALPTFSVLIRLAYTRSRKTPASGPWTSILPSVDTSTIPTSWRTFLHSRCHACA